MDPPTTIGMSTDLHTYMFVHTLYPLHNITLCLSIYMTVALAMERYLAVTKPIDYHMVIGKLSVCFYEIIIL